MVRLALTAVLCAAFLSACGSGASGDPISDFQGSAGEPFLDPTLPEFINLAPDAVAPLVATISGDGDPIVAAALPQSDLPFDDPTDLDQIGPIVTMADTGLRIGFANGLDTDAVDVNLIEDSWTNMQSCLNVISISPLVIVSQGPVLPMSSSDDVLFYIDGTIIATSTQFASGATIQINLADLNGSLNRVGFNLRSIMGRYLWTSANLPEQDYPHGCASEN